MSRGLSAGSCHALPGMDRPPLSVLYFDNALCGLFEVTNAASTVAVNPITSSTARTALARFNYTTSGHRNHAKTAKPTANSTSDSPLDLPARGELATSAAPM